MSLWRNLARLALTTVLTAGFVACGDDTPTPTDGGITPQDTGVIIDAGITEDGGVVDIDITVDPATLTLQEGGAAATFAVSLTGAPADDFTVTITSADLGAATVSPATLTFTPDNFSTPQTITVTPIDDADTRDENVEVAIATDLLGEITVAVAVEDDDVQSLVVAPTSLTMAEGASDDFTVALAFEPDTDVTVTVASADSSVADASPTSLTFTVANYATAQTVTVTGVDDANTADDTTTVGVSSSGLDSVDVSITVTDVDQQGIVASPTSLAIDEGASDTVSVSLGAQPTSPVTITVTSADPAIAGASPSSLSFDASNWDVAQTVTVSGTEDPDTIDASTSVTLSAAGLDDVSIAVDVTDNDTQAIVVSQTALTIGEGATATVGVSLMSQPTADVTVTLTSGNGAVAAVSPTSLTFTTTNWGNPQTVIVTGQQDPNLTDDATTITASANGLTPVVITVTVTDDDTQALVISPTSITVSESGSQGISVRLAYQPAGTVAVGALSGDTAVATVGPASLSFDSTNWNINQTFTVAGVNDPDIVDGNTDVTISSAGLTDTVIPVTVVDDDVQNISVNPTSLDLTEGGNAGTFAVSLTQQPTADVTVTVASSDGLAASVDVTTIVFDSTNYNVPVTVTVTPENDNDAVDENVTITLSSAPLTARQVTVTVADNDVQAHIVTPVALTLQEQGPVGTFTVRLAFEPIGNAQVNITSGDPLAVSVTPSALTFNAGNYDQPQTITVAGLSDPDLVDELVNVAVASALAPTVNVAVTVQEDDLQALVVSTNDVTVTEDTGPGTFTVRLQFQPVNTVGVTVVVDDPSAATVNPTNILFTTTNYNQPVTINVVGTTDQDQVSEGTFATVASPGLPSEVVNINVTDDDFQAIQLSRNAITMDEGGADETFTVSLAFIPLNATEVVDVTSSDDLAAGAAPAQLTFDGTDYFVAQTVTVNAPADNDVVDELVTVTMASDAAATPDATVTVTVNDDDTQAIIRAPTAMTLYEGAVGGPDSADISYQLMWDPTGSAGDVVVVSQDPQAARSNPNPTTLTFDDTNYNVDQFVTIFAQDDADVRNETLNIVSSNASTPGSNNNNTIVTVIDDDTQAILVDTEGETVTEEGTTTFNVRLEFQPTNDVTVTVTSGDNAIATVDLTTLTFTPQNYSVNQTVTITGTTDANLDDEQTTITLSTGILAPPEGATDVVFDVFVNDNDVQQIFVESIPTTLPASIQEEGPTVDFNVWLEFPPRGGAGAQDIVTVTSPDGARLDLTPTQLTFDDTNFGDRQRVTAAALRDLDSNHHQFDALLEIPVDDAVSTPFPIRVIDDEVTVLTTVSYPGLDGGTEFTRRANIAWGTDRLAITAYDQAGNTLAVNDSRELNNFVQGAALGVTGGVSPVETVDFDGTDFGFFISTPAGINFVRADEGLQQTISVNVAAATAIDFWPTWNGTAYGVIYRNSANNNLRFRTVSLNGAVSAENQVTFANATPDLHPNLHWTGAGYVALYSAGTEVRCVEMNGNGFAIGGTDVALADFPAGGAFVSSVWDGASVVAVYLDPTEGIVTVRIDPNGCSIIGIHRSVRPADTYLTNPPTIAYNGIDFAVAYDKTDLGVDTVGVVIVNDDLTFRENAQDVMNGTRPSITWASDRWAVRAAGSVDVVVGSFQSDHCSNAVRDADEVGVDCGGSDCDPCTFGFTCNDAINLGTYTTGVNTVVSGNTCGAGDDVDAFESCAIGGNTSSEDVIYTLTVDTPMTLSIDTCEPGTQFDTGLAVNEGICAALGPPETIACNDDVACPFGNFRSQVTPALVPGVTYYIHVEGWSTACGQYELRLEDVTQPPG